jgi:hypothetical protein
MMSENKLEVGNFFRIDNNHIGIRAMWLDLDTGQPMVEIAIQLVIRMFPAGSVKYETLTVAAFLERWPALTLTSPSHRLAVPFWEEIRPGQVARLLEPIDRGKNPSVPVGALGVVSTDSKYGDIALVQFPAHGSFYVSRNVLESVRCARCSGSRRSVATNIIQEWQSRDDATVVSTPLCDDCHEEWQFMSLWQFLVDGRIPDLCHIEGWKPIEAEQAASIMWLLQEHYGFMGDSWDVCEGCHEPYNRDNEYYASVPGVGVVCEDCSRKHGADCDECGEFKLWADLDDDDVCQSCRAPDDNSE